MGFEGEMRRLRDAIYELTEAIRDQVFCMAQRGRTIPAIVLVKEAPVPLTVVDHATFSNLKTQLNTISTLPNGDPDPDAVVTVTSSDPSQVGIEVNPDGGYFITTPGDSGTAVISSKTVSPGKTYDEFQINFSYVAPPVGKTVPVIGSDVPDA